MEYFERISDLLHSKYKRNVRYPLSMIFSKAQASVLEYMEFELQDVKDTPSILFKDHSKESEGMSILFFSN